MVVLAVLAVGGILWFRTNYFPKHAWDTDYKRKSEQPYGLAFFYKTIKEQDFETTLIYNGGYWQLDTTVSDNNFIIIGNYLDADSVSVDRILDFVKKGNRALIAVDDAPMDLFTRFVQRGDSIEEFRMRPYYGADIRFIDSAAENQESLWFNYQQQKDTAALYSWGGYMRNYFEDTLTEYGFKPLALLNDTLITAFYINHGEGQLIIHANPITLTNYHFAKHQGFVHARNLTNMLHQGHTYWYDLTSTSRGYSEAATKNPLKFLFSHPHLLWAWYLFLLTVVLYVFFRSKREQRVIRMMPTNHNTTLDFAKTVGLLYYKQGGQRQIVVEMHNVFLADIRARYNITTDSAQSKLIEQIVKRSGVEENVVKEIFRQFNYLRDARLATGEDIIRLHKAIEQFNKQRK